MEGKILSAHIIVYSKTLKETHMNNPNKPTNKPNTNPNQPKQNPQQAKPATGSNPSQGPKKGGCC